MPASLMDRSLEAIGQSQLAVRLDSRGPRLVPTKPQALTWLQESLFQQGSESDARLQALLVAHVEHGGIVRLRCHSVNACLCDLDVARVALDAYPAAVQPFGNCASGW